MCANIFEGDAVKIEIISSQQLAKDYANLLLENLKNENYTHLL